MTTYRPNPPCVIDEATRKRLEEYCKPFSLIHSITIEDNQGDKSFSINDGEYQIEIEREVRHEGTPEECVSTAFILSSCTTIPGTYENPPEDDIKQLKFHCHLDEIFRVMLNHVVDDYAKYLPLNEHLEEEYLAHEAGKAADDGVSL